MRRLLTGLNDQGQSCVVEENEILPTEATRGIAMAMLFATSGSPAPPRPEGHGELLSVGVEPGCCHWMILDWASGHSWSTVHHTDTIDFHTVLSGSLDLILDTGLHALEPGDCVVVTGIDHAWRSGPSGCRVSSVMLGTPPLP